MKARFLIRVLFVSSHYMAMVWRMNRFTYDCNNGIMENMASYAADNPYHRVTVTGYSANRYHMVQLAGAKWCNGYLHYYG